MISIPTIKSGRGIAAIVLAMMLALPAAHAQPAKAGSAAMPSAPMQGAAMAPGDMKGMMKDMNDKMSSMQMSGDQDVDFAMMMRMHHQGAISMAEMELKAGKEPEMKSMARNVISSQRKEIAKIDKFLAKRGHQMDKMKK
ncbi:MAG: DUF305 domain-containing protein [Ramlibacter sp.]|nr:DUF305 domain-containing protein [Ramlibacter sp.]